MTELTSEMIDNIWNDYKKNAFKIPLGKEIKEKYGQSFLNAYEIEDDKEYYVIEFTKAETGCEHEIEETCLLGLVGTDGEDQGFHCGTCGLCGKRMKWEEWPKKTRDRWNQRK